MFGLPLIPSNPIELWFYTIYSFVLAMYAKHNWDRLTLFWKVMLVPAGVVGFGLDVVFNYTFGFMFGEIPPLIDQRLLRFRFRAPELLFSSRVQRIYSTGSGWRLRLAGFWKRNLNIPDPDHIRDTRRYAAP